MVDTSKENVNENIENSKTNVKEIFEKDERQIQQELMLQKIREEVLQKFKEYKMTLNYMAADAPIGILCLPKAIETALIENRLLRVYDLFDVDLTKVKGLGIVRIRQLTTILDQFFSML